MQRTFNETEPQQILNYLNSSDIKYLVELFKNSSKKINSNILSHISIKGTDYADQLVERLKKDFGDFTLRSATIWEATEPHNIHNNDRLETGNPHLGFVFPLYHEGGVDTDAKLIFLRQYYYNGAAKFYGGETEEREVYYNQLITDYKDVKYKENGMWSTTNKSFKEKYLPQIKDRWLEGLSLHTAFPWAVGSMMKFDVCRLHVASDFRKAGIKRKIGMALFTEKP